MKVSSTLRVATLGGPTTFAGRATQAMTSHEPRFTGPVYMPGMADLWSALQAEEVDVIVLSADSTGAGPGDTVQRMVSVFPKPTVIRELLIPYGCSLLVKPGTTLDRVQRVLGHGSLRQCTKFLQENLPAAEVQVLEDLNSAAAAEQVVNGDGTTAVVSTPQAAENFGLVELATDIDQGALGLWWAICSASRYEAEPRRLLVTARFDGDGSLGATVTRMAQIGYVLDTAVSYPTGDALFRSDYLLSFRGSGQPIALVEEAVQGLGNSTLVGALHEPLLVAT